MPNTVLKGMTWSHPRGYDPLVEASRVWQARGGAAIAWDQRSLQDFEAYPVEDLARAYDLIVIDHPHVGQVAGENCLLPLDAHIAPEVLAGIAAGTVGQSYASYTWKGHQWALPVDAAAQVQAWVPGRIAAPLKHWREVAPLAAEGRLLCPLRPPHNLMSLYTLCGLNGVALPVGGPDLFPAAAVAAYDQLLDLARRLDPACYDMDPIAAFEAVGRRESKIAAVPLVYGYVSYARAGFREVGIAFADIPEMDAGPAGSALGGTGIAVSAFSRDSEAAAAFAAWVCGGDIQRTLYVAAGGQAGHAAAWADAAVNQAVAGFYAHTRRTLDQAWVRPRHDGYMAFQSAASERLNAALRAGEDGTAAVAALNALFRQSLSRLDQ